LTCLALNQGVGVVEVCISMTFYHISYVQFLKVYHKSIALMTLLNLCSLLLAKSNVIQNFDFQQGKKFIFRGKFLNLNLINRIDFKHRRTRI